MNPVRRRQHIPHSRYSELSNSRWQRPAFLRSNRLGQRSRYLRHTGCPNRLTLNESSRFRQRQRSQKDSAPTGD